MASRRSARRRTVAIRRLELGLLLVAGVSIGGLGCGGGGHEADVTRTDCANYRFDRERWATYTDGVSPRRQEAVALVRCRVLDSMSKSSVRRLLGQPYEKDEDEWSYLLGDEQSAVPIDGEYLS